MQDQSLHIHEHELGIGIGQLLQNIERSTDDMLHIVNKQACIYKQSRPLD